MYDFVKTYDIYATFDRNWGTKDTDIQTYRLYVIYNLQDL